LYEDQRSLSATEAWPIDADLAPVG